MHFLTFSTFFSTVYKIEYTPYYFTCRSLVLIDSHPLSLQEVQCLKRLLNWRTRSTFASCLRSARREISRPRKMRSSSGKSKSRPPTNSSHLCLLGKWSDRLFRLSISHWTLTAALRKQKGGRASHWKRRRGRWVSMTFSRRKRSKFSPRKRVSGSKSLIFTGRKNRQSDFWAFLHL